MLLAHQAKRSDPLGRYYTSPMVSMHLITAMNLSCPNTVIDLGAGSGELVKEATKVWTDSRYFTVDIDSNAQSSKLPDIFGEKFKHQTADALDLELAQKLGLNWAEVDAAICNPPYLLPKWKKHFEEILEDAGLRRFISKTGDITADLLFVAQNLRMLKNGGTLGLIIPDGIIAGEKYSALRKSLIETHCIEKVIELPRNIFRKTEAKAHILILSKSCGSNEFIQVSKVNQDGSLEKEISVPTESFVKRLDYSYIKGKKSFAGKRRIADVTKSVFRGTISSVERHEQNLNVFHTTDFVESDIYVPSRFNVSQAEVIAHGGRFAQAGDILVARVGRNLSGKISMVNDLESVLVSDCIIVLRVDKTVRSQLFNFLRSERGRLCIETGSRGVGAKYITVGSLGEIQF
ncbi:MAG: N-6 DNA methylase [Pseudohongiella sp.]|nr:N-6 DNA methylase [Pseudohongiella sp.]